MQIARPSGSDVASPPRRYPVDVLAGQQIDTADGRVVPLSMPPTRQALRVGDGWLVETYDPLHSVAALCWVGDPSTVHAYEPWPDAVKLAEGDRVAVSADGARVAWGRGHTWVAARHGSILDIPQRTDGVAGLDPVAFAGAGVLLCAAVPGPDRALSA